MLAIEGVEAYTSKTYLKGALSNQLTDIGRGESVLGGERESVDMRRGVQRYSAHTIV
jgi:hypothetical protein